jgi:hypothetical protein
LTEQKNGLVSYSSTIINEKGTMMKQKKLGIAGLALVLFATFFTVNVSADKPGSGIEVVEATWGQGATPVYYPNGCTNGEVVPTGNITNDVTDACDGLESCEFNVLTQIDIGTVPGAPWPNDPAYGCAKELVVDYVCDGESINITTGASTVTLECAIADEMVNVCHKAGKRGKTMTLYINHAAVAAHVRHGDTEGECGGEPPLEF